MTSELLYGVRQTGGFTQASTMPQNATTELSTPIFGGSQANSADQRPGLVDLATIYSIDASTGSRRSGTG